MEEINGVKKIKNPEALAKSAERNAFLNEIDSNQQLLLQMKETRAAVSEEAVKLIDAMQLAID